MEPFSGLKVLDISSGVAGSFCARLLADHGADVYKASLIGRADLLFPYGSPEGLPDCGSDSAMYHFLNLNKQQLPKFKSGSYFEDFLSEIDILMEDLVPHERDKPDFVRLLSGLPSDVLRCSITPFGCNTEWSDRPYSDLTIQAITGYCSVNGSEGCPPLKEPGRETEFSAGANAFVGLASAIIYRDNTGVGQDVDVSILHTALASYGPYLLAALHTGEPRYQQKQGLHFGLVRCKDGYVSMSVRHEPTWEHLWIFLGDPDFAKDPRFDSAVKRRRNEPELAKILLPELAKYTRKELLTGLSPLRILVGPANSMIDLMNDEHLRERDAFFVYGTDITQKMPSNPVKMSGTPWKYRNHAPNPDSLKLGSGTISPSVEKFPRKLSSRSSRRPLSELRAVVLTQAWAGAYCTQILGDLGMEVIQVESVNRIDPWRGGIPPRLSGLYPDGKPGKRPWDRNALYNSVNRNKKGITLDLNDDECRSALLDLVASSDLFVENFSGRVIGNLGLDYETLVKENPSIVMLRMPTYGTFGPYANFPGNGGTTEPVSGMSYLMGYEGGPPLNSGIMHTDAYSGILAAGAAVTALRYRQLTGYGQCVEISQQEATLSLLAEFIMESSTTGKAPCRQGNSQKNVAPQGCYLSMDGNWVALTVSGNEKWASFCKAIDKDDLGSDPRFFDINSRFENRLALDEIISKILGEVDAASFTRRLRGFGIPCEIVLNTREVVLNSDFHKMGLFKKVKHDASGTFDHVVPAWELSQTPATIDLPAPTLGRHTKSVLSDILGWPDQRIKDLFVSGNSGNMPAV